MGLRGKDATLMSLLAKGIPGQWATEEESAALSGMSYARFSRQRADLEAHGFPKIDPFTGQRFIPAILDFWRARSQPSGEAPITEASERVKENWNAAH